MKYVNLACSIRAAFNDIFQRPVSGWAALDIMLSIASPKLDAVLSHKQSRSFFLLQEAFNFAEQKLSDSLYGREDVSLDRQLGNRCLQFLKDAFAKDDFLTHFPSIKDICILRKKLSEYAYSPYVVVAETASDILKTIDRRVQLSLKTYGN